MVIPMSADPWIDRLSEYVDDELEPSERLQLEQHLLDCPRCRAKMGKASRLFRSQAPPRLLDPRKGPAAQTEQRP